MNLLVALLDLIFIGAIFGYWLGRIRPIRRARKWAADRRERCAEPGCKRCYPTRRWFGDRLAAEWDNPDDAVYDQQQTPACPSVGDPKSSQVNGT